MSATSALPILLRATFVRLDAREQPEVIKLALRPSVVGILTGVVVGEITVSASKNGQAILAAPVFASGLGLFALLSARFD